MKYVAIVAGLIVLIGALFFLNQGIKHNALTDEDETAQDQAAQVAAAAKPQSAASVSAVSGTYTLPAEQTVQDPSKAKTKITVGWVYDEVNQPHPEALNGVLDYLRHAADASSGSVSLEIVNLDAPKEELSGNAASVTDLGIAINGKSLFTVNGKTLDLSDNPGEGNATIPNIQNAIKTLNLGVASPA